MALPRPPMLPPFIGTNVLGGPASPMDKQSNCGQNQDLGQPSHLSPDASCEAQEQMEHQYQLSGELRHREGGRRHFHRDGKWESCLEKPSPN